MPSVEPSKLPAVSAHRAVAVGERAKIDRRTASAPATAPAAPGVSLEVSAPIDPAAPPQVARPLPFSDLVRQDADGVWRSPAEQVRPGRQAGIWIPPSVPLTAPLRAFFSEAQAITTVYGLGPPRWWWRTPGCCPSVAVR